MRVYTALPVPARRRSGRPLNASSLGRTQSGLCCSAHPPPRPSADRRGFQPVGVTVRGSLVSFRSLACGSPRVLPARLAASVVAAQAASLARSAAIHARRVRPNQALQRTGSVPGFTLLSRLQPVVGLAGR